MLSSIWLPAVQAKKTEKAMGLRPLISWSTKDEEEM